MAAVTRAVHQTERCMKTWMTIGIDALSTETKTSSQISETSYSVSSVQGTMTWQSVRARGPTRDTCTMRMCATSLLKTWVSTTRRVLRIEVSGQGRCETPHLIIDTNNIEAAIIETITNTIHINHLRIDESNSHTITLRAIPSHTSPHTGTLIMARETSNEWQATSEVTRNSPQTSKETILTMTRCSSPPSE